MYNYYLSKYLEIAVCNVMAVQVLNSKTDFKHNLCSLCKQ